MKLDWENYRTTFPDRYLRSGFFDQEVKAATQVGHSMTILDIGGGEGTVAIRDNVRCNKELKVYLLDPHVKAPHWMAGNVSMETDIHFDLGVARGSINYLTKPEIKKLPSLCTHLMANTFKNPPGTEWVSRAAENTFRKPLIERYRLREFKQARVEHELILEDGQKISHSFFYYTVEDFKELWPGVKIVEYGKNSIILTV